MSYKALYRTYRPNNFNEVVGQDHIVNTLRNIISNNKIGHAYLFAGPRGTGKTSVAHVFARAVNVTATGKEVFNDMDIIEIDAASNNGVAEVRSIIDNVNYAPVKAQYKVYIIDEVHMLTKGAFNALLKTLEEPPAHVIFILATTEPHKIPVTILSRTQRFNFRRIESSTIGKQLVNILSKEEIKYDEESIKFISRLAQGGMRDALSIADQASAFGNGVVTFETISQVFGIISIQNQIKILNLAYLGKSKELMRLITEFLDNGADIERLSSSILDILKDFIIYKKTNDYSLIQFISDEELNILNIDIDYAYETVDVMMKLIADLRFTPVPRQSFELSILQISKHSDNSTLDELIESESAEEKNIVNNIIPSISNSFDEKNIKPERIIDESNRDETSEIDELFNGESEDGDNSISSFDENANIESKHDLDFSVIQDEQEKMNDEATVEDNILNTQEIPIKENDDTADLDIVKLFETPVVDKEPKIETENDKKHTVDIIINLLVQARREDIELIKQSWTKIGDFISNNKYKQFAVLLSKAKIISAGETFALISSDDQFVIDGINQEVNNPNFIRFVSELVGKPIKIFAINKNEFAIVKESWMSLSSSNSLPTAIPVSAPTVEKRVKSEEEEFGSSLFGDLFSA